MTLKGDYNSGTSYSVKDVVRWDNGEIYILLKPCAAGNPPPNTLYWGKISGAIGEVISMMVDLMNSTNTAIADVAETVPTNIDDEGIVLTSGDNEYLISVDATGDTPELAVELIEDEEGGES